MREFMRIFISSFILAVTFFALSSFNPPAQVNAQSCTGPGFVCYYGCTWDSATRTWRNCTGSQNRGCGSYPDCGIMPNTSGCNYWTGTCYVSGGGGGGGGGSTPTPAPVITCYRCNPGGWCESYQTTGSCSTNCNSCSGGGGGGGGSTPAPTATAPPALPPPSVSLTASPSNVASGSNTLLRWTVSNANYCVKNGSWAGPVTAPGSGQLSFGPLTAPSTYYFYLNCAQTSTGRLASGTAIVTTYNPTPPQITLRANPTTVNYNGYSVLTWSISNADYCVKNGDWSGQVTPPNGNGSTTVTNLTKPINYYYLNCSQSSTGLLGSATATVRVNQPTPTPTPRPATPTATPRPATATPTPQPPSVDLRADGRSGSTTISYNSSATLSWTTERATSCIASSSWSGSKSVPSGSQSTGNLTSSRTYRLTCIGPGGSRDDQVQVNVSGAPTAPPPTATPTPRPTATPTPRPTPTPTATPFCPGGTCRVLSPSQRDCGAWAEVPGSGFCGAGSLCCVPGATPIPSNCPYTINNPIGCTIEGATLPSSGGTCSGGGRDGNSCTSTFDCYDGSCALGTECTCSVTSGAFCCNGLVPYESSPGNNICACPSSCGSVTFAEDPINVVPGITVEIPIVINGGSGSVDEIRFTSNNTSVATVALNDPNPADGWHAVVTGVGPGVARLTANVTKDPATLTACTGTADVIGTALPWWQVKGGTVFAQGSVTTEIPVTCTGGSCIPRFILDGGSSNQYSPGMVIYGGSYDFGEGSVSSKNWIASSTYNGRPWSYSSITGLIPRSHAINEISGATVSDSTLDGSSPVSSDGYIWYKKTGDLTINGDVSISGKKVILLVENGDLYINGRVNLGSTNDFFMAIVGSTGGAGGNIIVGDAVTAPENEYALEGVYFADSNFNTGAGDLIFRAKGSLSANTFSLNREGGGNTEPAEFFEYAPEIMVNYPTTLNPTNVAWKEVVP